MHSSESVFVISDGSADAFVGVGVVFSDGSADAFVGVGVVISDGSADAFVGVGVVILTALLMHCRRRCCYF
jgi:hypothetical protein